MDAELPAPPRFKCLKPGCEEEVDALTCARHREYAAELIAECDGGIPKASGAAGLCPAAPPDAPLFEALFNGN